MLTICLYDSELLDAAEFNDGYCVECGELTEGVEPDARKCPCEECGANAVYGVPELMLMGQIQIIY